MADPHEEAVAGATTVDAATDGADPADSDPSARHALPGSPARTSSPAQRSTAPADSAAAAGSTIPPGSPAPARSTAPAGSSAPAAGAGTSGSPIPHSGTRPPEAAVTAGDAVASRASVRPMRVSVRSAAVLLAVSLVGLAMFVWPLFADVDSELAHSADAPLLFAVVLGLLVIVLVSEVISGELDAKALAMLGVLAATAAALRPLGSGVSGFQPMFLILLIGGRALGPGFGFSLGLVAMFGSALLTAGVGPWLPFQMLGAAWLGMGAGLLPRAGGRAEVAMLAVYGAVAGLLYGFLLNLWFWPFLTTADSAISFVPGDPLADNLMRFLVFCLITSLGFDLPRAIGNALLIAIAGGPMLRAIRRATRRANFAARATFQPAATTPTAPTFPTPSTPTTPTTPSTPSTPN